MNIKRIAIIAAGLVASVALGCNGGNTDRAVSTVRDSYEFNNGVKVSCNHLVQAYDYYIEDNHRNRPTDSAKQDKVQAARLLIPLIRDKWPSYANGHEYATKYWHPSMLVSTDEVTIAYDICKVGR